MKNIFVLIDDDRDNIGVFESREIAIKKLLEQYGEFYKIENLRDVRDSGVDCDFYLVDMNNKDNIVFMTLLDFNLNELN